MERGEVEGGGGREKEHVGITAFLHKLCLFKKNPRSFTQFEPNADFQHEMKTSKALSNPLPPNNRPNVSQ